MAAVATDGLAAFETSILRAQFEPPNGHLAHPRDRRPCGRPRDSQSLRRCASRRPPRT